MENNEMYSYFGLDEPEGSVNDKTEDGKNENNVKEDGRAEHAESEESGGNNQDNGGNGDGGVGQLHEEGTHAVEKGNGKQDVEGSDEVTGDGGDAAPAEDKPSGTADDAAAQKAINATNAAARRKAERDREIAKVRAEEQLRTKAIEDAAYAKANEGKINPYTGKPILSKKDFDEYQKAFTEEKAKVEADKRRESLKKAGIDESVIQQIVSENPAVKKAAEVTAAAEAARKANVETMRKRLIDADIAEIAKMDSSITDLDALRASPKGKEIEERVQSGRNTYLEAWKLAYFDSAFSAKSAAAKQAESNAANSKAHMEPVKPRGQGGVTVPAEIKEQYRAFGITDESEITKEYTKYINSKKKG